MTNNRADLQDAAEPMRLQRYLARAGVASRRACDALVAEGRVSVNGQPAQVGQKVVPGVDEVFVDGVRVDLGEASVTLMLNKPAGVVTSMARQGSERIVADLLPLERYPGLYPLGRLDSDATGLLLFSTDGQLGHALLHPSHHVPKTYEVTVTGALLPEEVEQLRRGINTQDFKAQPAEVRVFGKRGNRAEITVHEGQYHQVKRMFEAVGHKVVQLRRIKLGPLELGELAPGTWRLLTDEELTRLNKCATKTSDGC